MFEPVTQTPPLLAPAHLPSLDGLRAVSILMVLLGHLVISYHNFPGVAPALAVAFPVSHLGVEFFFVISGFLITTLLLKERVSTQAISLRNFYLRRFFRIVPVAYLYLTLVLVANVTLHLHLDYWLLLASFLFVRNFFIHPEGVNNLAAHYWSLSVEEQFYLLFPVVLKKYFSFYVLLLFLIVTLSVCADLFAGITHPAGPAAQVGVSFIQQFQSIAIGSLCSIYLFKHPARSLQTLPHRSLVSAVLFAAILATCLLPFGLPQVVTLLQSLLFAAIMVLNLQVDRNWSYRLLNHRWMRFIGVLSYSLYIWQQPLTQNLSFIDKVGAFRPYQNSLPVHLGISLVSVILLCGVSTLSYFCFEKRFLALKRRFSPKTTGSAAPHTASA